MKQIIVFPRGQLNAKDKERLTKHGILAVEADDPSKIVSVFPSIPLLEANDMLTVALRALADSVSDYNASPPAQFTKKLAQMAEAKSVMNPEQCET